METKDFAFAAYLVTMGFSLQGTRRDDSVLFFQFGNNDKLDNEKRDEENKKLEEEALKFFSRKALVEPIAFNISMKSLKTIMYSVKNS